MDSEPEDFGTSIQTVDDWNCSRPSVNKKPSTALEPLAYNVLVHNQRF